MTTPFRILILVPATDEMPAILPLLAQYGYHPEIVRYENLEEVQVLPTLNNQDLIIIAPPAGTSGLTALSAIKETCPGAAVVLLLSTLSDHELTELFAAGVFNVLEKHLPSRILQMVMRAEQDKRLTEAGQELRRYQQTQEILNRLLHLALSSTSIPEMLKLFLNEITELPWLGLETVGAALLVDKDDPNALALVADRGLSRSLQTICARVPFGHCLCGRVATSKQIVFADCIDDRHDNTYEGIKPHGHYCVPIISADHELLGVFTLYTKAGCIRDIRVEETLSAAASVAASIIKRLRNEDALRISEEKYRVITSTAKDAIILIDQTGHITYWNPAAENSFGYSSAEVSGHELHELLLPAQLLPDFQQGFSEFQKTGTGPIIGHSAEMIAVHKDGHEFPVEISINTLKKETGFAAVGIVRDISARKKLENDKEMLKANLERAKSMEAIATLAGGIAHDFNNILTAILGFAEMAKDSIDAQSQVSSDLDQVINGAKRAKDLVNQILIFSRQSQGHKAPVQVHLLIKETLKLLRSSLPPSVKLRQNIETDCGAVLADPVQIHQILINLCTNAVQAMQDSGGALTVTLKRETLAQDSLSGDFHLTGGNYIRLTVSDTGCGMSPDVVERVFEPYFTTREVSEGSGLGLSVVHGIVVNLGGAVKVTSAPRQGTTFSVYLPCYISRQEKVVSRTAMPAGGSEHILFLDDEKPLVRLGSAILLKLGYTVSSFTSGQEALAAFCKAPQDFQLVISDLSMPEMNGLDFSREILTIRTDIPIIITTGFSETVTEQEILDLGVRKLLIKPYVTREFGEAIRQVLDQQAANNKD